MQITKKYLDELTYQVIPACVAQSGRGCAIEVHKYPGPGLLESVYEKCFLQELNLRGIANKSQVWTPLEYKGLLLDTELRLDVLVEDILCVELKAQSRFLRDANTRCSITVLYANAAKAERHSYKFSLCKYF